METFPKHLFEMVKTTIVSGDEGQVMGILGEGGRRGWVGGGHGIAVFG